jgi:ABC-type uncharacterized transport system substrate-binding protein
VDLFFSKARFFRFLVNSSLFKRTPFHRTIWCSMWPRSAKVSTKPVSWKVRTSRSKYRWAEGQYERMAELAADLVRRQVAVIAVPGNSPGARASKAATATIPIVFGVGEDPVKLGLVASLARPGGNATGIDFFGHEVATKRLGLLHELVPKAVRIAVVVNPANAPSAEAALRAIPDAARAIELQTQFLKASTSEEIEAAFATLLRDRADALFVAGDAFFVSSASNLRRSRPVMRYPRSMPFAGMSKPAA